MLIQEQLQTLAADAIKGAFSVEILAAEIVVQPTSKDHSGDFTLVLFPLLKRKLGSPDALVAAIGSYLVQHSGVVASYELVKGFLNVTLTNDFWLQFVNDFYTKPEAILNSEAGKGQTVMVEFSSPNTNKPLHLGHLRNNFLGDSLSRLLQAAGFTVVRACLVNDRGIHICKSMLAWQRYGKLSDGTPDVPSIARKGDHLVGDYYVRFDKDLKAQVRDRVAQGLTEEEAERGAPIMQEIQDMLRKWEAADPDTRALWQRMNQWVYDGFAQTYTRMGVTFDKYYYESETYLLGKDIIDEGLRKNVFYRRPDGSVWIDLRPDGLDEKLVLRADGTSVYMTQDLGTSDLKYADYHMQRSVYVIGNEQDYHMKVLMLIMQKLGRPYAAGMFHLSYGMVELPSGKMKSREGTVVDADDLMQEVVTSAKDETSERGKTEGLTESQLAELHEMLGMGALKYYLLKVSPQKKMLFDPQESVSLQGDTGPFIQYTHARIHSLLEKAAQMNLLPAEDMTLPALQLLPAERSVTERLYQWPGILSDAVRTYDPSALAAYACDLAKDYNRFYYELPILREAEGEAEPARKQLRLRLSQLTALTLKHVMGLMGIAVPNRM